MFFTNQGHAEFYRGAVLKKLKSFCITRSIATGLSGIKLLHDNASTHKAATVRNIYRQENVVEIPHPPYSPVVAPCDYFLFPRLTGRIYKTRKDLT